MTLATIDKNAASVVSVLENAKTWLSTAVEMTGPEDIAAAKAQIRTAETYARELHLSKDIQDDASEMVRRAEYAMSKSIRKGQAEGTIQTRADGPAVRDHGPSETKLPVRQFLPTGREREHHADIADVTQGDFDAALSEARAEGNLSRANVARKAREVSNLDTPRAAPRRALPDQFFDATYDLTKVTERIDRLVADDRFPQNAEKVAAKHRNDLLRAVELLTRALDRLV